MKRALIVAALAALSAACQSQGQDINDHWNARSNAPRITRFFLGYDGEKDGDYRDFAWERKQDINLFLRRHFLHHNPDNPNHVEWPGRYRNRPNNSPLPNPVNYFHLEGLLLGFAASGSGGSFALLPLDSLIGTVFEEGGYEEFWDGIGETLGEGFVGPILDVVPGGGRTEAAVVTASFPVDSLDEDLDGEFISTLTVFGSGEEDAE